MKARKEKARTDHERDLMDLLAHGQRSDASVADAIVTVLRRADARTLAALGVILEFVTTQTPKRRR